MCKILSMIALVLAFTGCAWQGVPASWHGRDLDELITYWGPPDQIYTLKNGGQSVKYQHQRFGSSFYGTSTYATGFGTTYWCEVRFTTDSNGVITSSVGEGNLGGCNTFFRGKPQAP